MKDVYDIVLSYEKVREHLARHPQDKKKILDNINEIAGGYDFKWVKGTANLLDKTFARLYDGVNIIDESEESLSKLLEKYHLILVPNHQSHADYVALQYSIYKNFNLPVFVAAGINLNIFGLGSLFKRCGAFFIRRKITDDVYKISFQAYIYYLLKTDKIVEFFFEGGRTRTGKLLPPRYGLFSMILDAHSKFDAPKPLCFIPVTIAHEHIPEERAHAKELGGAKKEKEKVTQLFKIFKLFDKRLGTVHIKMGKGIVVDEVHDLKKDTQTLAFECFKAVGRGMPITPTALLAMIMLDDPSGVLTWDHIIDSAKEILDYCKFMGIPYIDSLEEDLLADSIRLAMDMLINNNKIKLTTSERLNKVFYSINEDTRVHLLFHKNMILHHFIVPAIMNTTWFNIFNGNIKTEKELTKFLLLRRKELKYEFYLQSAEEMVKEALRVVEYSLGKKVETMGETLGLQSDEFYAIAKKVRPFSTALSYIYEAYYTSSIAIKYLAEDEFTLDRYLEVAKELFDLEKGHGKIIHYPESFTNPSMKDNLKFLESMGIISKDDNDYYRVESLLKLNTLIESFARFLNEQISLNIKMG